MDFLKILVGDLDPAELAKRALTGLTASAAKPVLQEFFLDRVNAAGRIRLGEHLVKAGNALKNGNVADASGELATVIHEIKL